MNIHSQLKNLFAGDSSHSSQPDAQSSAPRAPHAQQGGQVNFGNAGKKSMTPTRAKDTYQPSLGASASLSAQLKALLKILDGLLQSIRQPYTQPSNTNNPSFNPNAFNDHSTNHVNRPRRNTPTTHTHAPNSSKAVTEPKNASPYSDKDLVDGFAQQLGTMNCVTVGGIKAAMKQYGGPKEIYSSVQKTADGYDVKMRDNPNKTYHVTNQEIQQATQQSGFSGNNPQMLNDANFMYAVSAKRAQEENNNGTASRSFSDALATLNGWEHTAEGLQRLGLQNHIQQATPQELANGAAGVMTHANHVFTVLNGRVEDHGRLGGAPGAWVEAYKLV